MIGKPNLLDLPTELLLEVGSHLGRDEALHTSLACRRLQHVGQQQLMRTSTTCPSRIWELAKTLLLRPDLAMVYTYLRIGRLESNMYSAIIYDLSQQEGARSDISCYVDVVSQVFPLFSTPEKPHNAIDVPTFIRLGLVVIISLAPNLSAMSMFTNVFDFTGAMLGLGHMEVRCRGGPGESWIEQVQEYIAQRLVEVAIFRERHVTQPVPRAGIPALAPLRQKQIHDEMASLGMLSLDVGRCERLEVLQTPLSRLRHASQFITFRSSSMMLPQNLKTLCIHAPGNSSEGLQAAVQSLITGVEQLALPHLRIVELRFRYNMISTAWSLCSQQLSGRNELERYRKWQMAPFRLITTFGDIKQYVGRRRNLYETRSSFEEGNMIAALERCLAIPREEMEQHPDIVNALGYHDHDKDADLYSHGSNHGGPIRLLRNTDPLA